MKIISLKAGQAELSPSDQRAVLDALNQEQVVVYPTDTLYGLGVDVCSETAVAELYRLKARQNSPVSVLVESIEKLLSITSDLSDKAQKLISQYLPGPLTVICKSDYPFVKQLYSERGTIGFRVPADSISCELPALLGRPVSTTSVNPAGETPAGSLEAVRNYYGENLALMLDKGPMKASLGSTVIDLSVTPFKILREGEISRQDLQEFLN